MEELQTLVEAYVVILDAKRKRRKVFGKVVAVVQERQRMVVVQMAATTYAVGPEKRFLTYVVLTQQRHPVFCKVLLCIN